MLSLRTFGGDSHLKAQGLFARCTRTDRSETDPSFPLGISCSRAGSGARCPTTRRGICTPMARVKAVRIMRVGEEWYIRALKVNPYTTLLAGGRTGPDAWSCVRDHPCRRADPQFPPGANKVGDPWFAPPNAPAAAAAFWEGAHHRRWRAVPGLGHGPPPRGCARTGAHIPTDAPRRLSGDGCPARRASYNSSAFRECAKPHDSPGNVFRASRIIWCSSSRRGLSSLSGASIRPKISRASRATYS